MFPEVRGDFVYVHNTAEFVRQARGPSSFGIVCKLFCLLMSRQNRQTRSTFFLNGNIRFDLIYLFLVDIDKFYTDSLGISPHNLAVDFNGIL